MRVQRSVFSVFVLPCVLTAFPALAAITTSGQVDPATVTTGMVVGQVTIGDETQSGSITVDGGSTLVVDNDPSVDGNRAIRINNSASSLVVSNGVLDAIARRALEVFDGADVVFDAGSQVLLVGVNPLATAIQMGGAASTTSILIDGAGTFVDLRGRLRLQQGGPSVGVARLTLSNGAQMVHDYSGASLFTSFLINSNPGSSELIVDSGSSLQSLVPNAWIGTGGTTGYMDISNGSNVELTAIVSIGGGGGTGGVTVTNSTFTIIEDPAFAHVKSGSVFVADGNPGTTASLTLDDGAIANIDNDVIIGYESGGDVPSDGPGVVSVCNSTLNADNVLIGYAGTLSGSTINANIQSFGTIEPGCSPGVMTVDGDVTIDGGELLIELAGPGNLDVLQVTGTTFVEPGSTITLAFENGYAPTAGDTYDFLQSSAVVLPPDPADVTVEFEGLVDDVDFDIDSSGGGFEFTANESGAPDFVAPLIDVRPAGSNNRLLPLRNYQFPVAILTTQDSPIFDATLVDPASVQFGPNGAMPTLKWVKSKDVDKDGDLDLLLWFRIRETGIACGDTSVDLTAQTFAGTAISGTDSIQTVGCP